MLDFLEKIAGTVEKMSSISGTDYLSLPGEAADYAFVRINKNNKIASVRLASRVGLQPKKVYRRDNQNMLFYGKELLETSGKPNLVRIRKTFARTYSMMRDIGPHLEDDSPHRQLADRMAKIEQSIETFASDLAEEVRNQKPQAKLAEIAFFFDHAERSILDEDGYEALNRAIQQSLLTPNEDEPSRTSDCFGDTGSLQIKAFQEVSVPKVGLVSCYTRNKDIPANAIYGRHGMQVCPLTRKNSDKFLRVFKEIVAGDLSSHVLAVRPGSDSEPPYLTIVCPTGFQRDTKVVIEKGMDDVLKMLGLVYEQVDKADEEAEKFSLSDFVSASKRVLDALSGKILAHPDAEFHMLVGKKPGKSPTIVVEENLSCSASQLLEQTTRWSEVMRSSDIPRPWRKPLREGEFDIKPARIERLVNMKWSRNAGFTGDKPSPVQSDTSSARISIGDCLRLYLFNDQDVAQRIMNLLASYHVNLMLDIGHRRIARSSDSSVNLGLVGRRRDIQQIPSLIAICLDKLGVSMTTVKTDPAFLMGRLCGLYSRAQQVYHSRNSRLSASNQPNKLIGQTFAATIMSGINPKGKFGVLTQRAMTFVDFVSNQSERLRNRQQNGKDHPVVILHRRIRKTTKLLAEQGGVPETFSAQQRVNFGLGYLSA